jgi:hypothetical protein
MSTEQQIEHPQIADDLIWGIEAIAKEINRTPRQVFHLAKAHLSNNAIARGAKPATPDDLRDGKFYRDLAEYQADRAA